MRLHSVRKFLFIILLIVLSVTAFVALSSKTSDLFSGENCQKACWQGLEPQISQQEDVEKYIGANSFEPTPFHGYGFTTNDPILSYSWQQNIHNALITPNSIVFVLFDETQAVDRITVFTKICLEDVIHAYGVPDTIAVESESILFFYTQVGIVFELYSKTNTIEVTYITSPKASSYLKSESAQIVNWEDLSASKSLECHDDVDNASA